MNNRFELMRPRSSTIKRSLLLGVLMLSAGALNVIGSAGAEDNQIDVISYTARIEPDIANRQIKGTVTIRFKTTASLSSAQFDCGELVIDSVKEGSAPQPYSTNEHQLKIDLLRPAREIQTRELTIDYHGAPRRGLRFFPDHQQVYTVFSTSQWLPCIDAPSDK